MLLINTSNYYVITRATLSMQWGKRLEDTGSDWQVDFGEDNISCLISSKDAGLNNENIGQCSEVKD